MLCTEHISMQLQQASLVCHLPWRIDAKMLLLQGSLSSKIIIFKKKKSILSKNPLKENSCQMITEAVIPLKRKDIKQTEEI